MKCEDLMIGDLVYHHNEVVRITGIGQNLVTYIYYHYVDCEVSEIEPIPLTAEILEKNGFKLNPQGSYSIGRHVSIDLIRDGRYFADMNTDNDAPSFLRQCGKYVHELQHALRLCGIEKEIIIRN